MFKEGNLVRLITEEGDREVSRVLEDVAEEHTIMHIAVGNDDSDSWVDIGDYELVTDELIEQEANKQEPRKLTRSIEDICDDIQLLFIQLCQYYQAAEISKSLKLSISGECYGSDNKLTVLHTACVGYGNDITTRRLDKSVQIAVDRAREDATLCPLEISFDGRTIDE